MEEWEQKLKGSNVRVFFEGVLTMDESLEPAKGGGRAES